MEVSKETHVMFQAELVGNVYMLRNLDVIVGGLQLSSTSKAAAVEHSDATINSSSDVQLYPKERLGLGSQQDSPNHYSYGGVNSYCVDQDDH